jgi:hypothetical protein
VDASRTNRREYSYRYLCPSSIHIYELLVLSVTRQGEVPRYYTRTMSETCTHNSRCLYDHVHTIFMAGRTVRSGRRGHQSHRREWNTQYAVHVSRVATTVSVTWSHYSRYLCTPFLWPGVRYCTLRAGRRGPITSGAESGTCEWRMPVSSGVRSHCEPRAERAGTDSDTSTPNRT